MKKTVALLAMVVLLSSASLALAKGGMGCGMGPGMGAGGGGMGCGMGPCMGGMMFHSLDRLNLSTEQWSKVASLRDAHMKEVMPIQNQLFAKNNELKLLWSQTNPDGAQIKAKEKELGELQMQMREKASQFMLDVRKVLTPEQQTKLSAMGPGMGRHHGCGQRRGPQQ